MSDLQLWLAGNFDAGEHEMGIAIGAVAVIVLDASLASGIIGAVKIAVLSDIHGNLPALQEVAADLAAWQPDHVVVNGDSVNRGPCSADCWDFMQEKLQDANWRMTMGNHEEYVLAHTKPAVHSDQANAMSFWTFKQMKERACALKKLPHIITILAPDKTAIRFCHASVHSTEDNFYSDTPESDVLAKIAPVPTVFCTAHTHVPYIRKIDHSLVVNSGSVGSPCDGDTRASYSRLLWMRGEWYAETIRLAYDRQETERHFFSSGYLESGTDARLVYQEWRTAHRMFPVWHQEYRSKVQAGILDENTAIDLLVGQVLATH